MHGYGGATAPRGKRRETDMIRDTKGQLRPEGEGLLADERGDVPGWVLVTLMTAGLVVAIWALAGPALADLFEQAIARVSGL